MEKMILKKTNAKWLYWTYFFKIAVLLIETQGLNIRKYFDSACEIHVKHSVNEEYK
jgi:hypothetical protein